MEDDGKFIWHKLITVDTTSEIATAVAGGQQLGRGRRGRRDLAHAEPSRYRDPETASVSVLDEQIDDGAETLNSGFESELVVRAARGRRGGRE